ncbi:hypothetical protein C2S51_018567, partial [Perilla frutescens var. frutescens]
MFLQITYLLHFMILLLALPSSSGSIARPECPDRCGNLQIPYPFGVGPGCSMEPSFDIICNASTNPPKAYLPIIHSEIIEINRSIIRVKSWKLAFSSNGQGGLQFNRLFFNLSETQYTLSDHNWLTAIGSQDMAAITGRANNRSFGGGCVLLCENRNDFGGVALCADDNNGHGLETGYCQTPIPKGTTSLHVNMFDLDKNWRKNKLFSTSYAFVGEKAIFNQFEFSYRLTNLDNNWTIYTSLNWALKHTLPVRLDWRIGTENCIEARKNPTTYACQSNTSDCIDFNTSNIKGYLCKCSKGYEGNPYLDSGCQDVDECADSTTNLCVSNAGCTNIPGSFNCLCPKGYSGDAMKDGEGCIMRPQSKVISILIGLGTGLGFIP